MNMTRRFRELFDRRRVSIPVADERRGKARVTSAQAQDILDVAVDDFNKTIMGILQKKRNGK